MGLDVGELGQRRNVDVGCVWLQTRASYFESKARRCHSVIRFQTTKIAKKKEKDEFEFLYRRLGWAPNVNNQVLPGG